jgi:tetratricopeptide (TPR) repeat protein
VSAADPLAWRYDAALREVPVDAKAFAQAVDRRVEEIAAARSQPKRLLAMLGEATPLLRIAGRLEEARRTASAAIAIAELLEDSRAAFASRVGLAAVMQWEGRFELSTPLFDQLIAQVRGTPELADLADEVLQQAGKNLLQQRRYAEAARCFRDALKLRRAKGDDALMEASAEALRVTQAAEQAAGVRR